MARRRSTAERGPEHILVDGYNVIFRHPELRTVARADLERARDELVRKLASAVPAGGALTVVFDGRQEGPPAVRSQRGGGVRVVFSTPPESADQCIQKLIEGTRSRAVAWRVVSSDREVTDRARLWGAQVTTTEAFLAEMRGGPRPRAIRDRPPPLSGPELAEWERLFRRRKEGGAGGESESSPEK